eukprot:2048351-Pyramimonas_sp.AAC.1
MPNPHLGTSSHDGADPRPAVSFAVDHVELSELYLPQALTDLEPRGDLRWQWRAQRLTHSRIDAIPTGASEPLISSLTSEILSITQLGVQKE